MYDHFGILLKSDKEASGCLLLEFDVAMQRVSLVNLPMGVDPFWVQSCQAVPPATEPGPDGVRVCEKTFDITEGSEIDVKIIVDHDMVEVFVGEQVAFTYRIYAKPEFETGLLAQEMCIRDSGCTDKRRETQTKGRTLQGCDLFPLYRNVLGRIA